MRTIKIRFLHKTPIALKNMKKKFKKVYSYLILRMCYWLSENWWDTLIRLLLCLQLQSINFLGHGWMAEEEAISKYSSNVKTCKGLGPSNSEELSMESQILLISKKVKVFWLILQEIMDRVLPWQERSLD